MPRRSAAPMLALLLAALSGCPPPIPEPGPTPVPTPGPGAPAPDPRTPRPGPDAASPGSTPAEAAPLPVAQPDAGSTPAAADTRGPLPPSVGVRSEEPLRVMFDTGGTTLVRQVGTCMPVQACTWILARKPGEPDVRIDTVAALSDLVPSVDTQVEALAFATFLTENRASLRDFRCELGVMRDGRFERWRLPADVTGDATAVTTSRRGDDGPFVVTRYLGCYTDAGVDRLVLSHEEIAPDGSYTLDDSKVLFEGTFLPRYR